MESDWPSGSDSSDNQNDHRGPQMADKTNTDQNETDVNYFSSSPRKIKRRRIKVFIRIRPSAASISKKKLSEDKCVFILHDKTILLDDFVEVKNKNRKKSRIYSGSKKGKKFVFDGIFDQHCHQEAVFEVTTKDLVRGMVDGYNGCVLAYGATGSGKTFTMFGAGAESGIVMLAFQHLFHILQTRQDDTQRYVVSLSYLEIYNENIKDLLNLDYSSGSSGASNNLELRGGGTNSVQICGLTELVVTSLPQALKLLSKGNGTRRTEKTGVNESSSRSHAILSLVIRKTSQDQLATHLTLTKLLFVDLAGSEKATRTCNIGKRLQEGSHINKSLLALRNCMKALSEGVNPRLVNFRDSKLTRLLREPLGGNYRTVLLAHITSQLTSKQETANTLLYASTAARISNQVTRNGSDYIRETAAEPSEYRSIINDLRQQIAQLQQPKSSCSSKHMRHCAQRIEKIQNALEPFFHQQIQIQNELIETEKEILILDWQMERQHRLINENQLKLMSKSDADTNWQELTFIEKEKERYENIRQNLVERLEESKKITTEAVKKESEDQTNLEDGLEIVVNLLCRVYYAQIEKMAMASERMHEENRTQKERQLHLKLKNEQNICDAIVTKQRQLIEDRKVEIPQDLQELYKLYQQEIQSIAASASHRTRHQITLPAISRSNDEDWISTKNSNSALTRQTSFPKIETSITTGESNNQLKTNGMSSLPSPIPAAVLFPPITF